MYAWVIRRLAEIDQPGRQLRIDIVGMVEDIEGVRGETEHLYLSET